MSVPIETLKIKKMEELRTVVGQEIEKALAAVKGNTNSRGIDDNQAV